MSKKIEHTPGEAGWTWMTFTGDLNFPCEQPIALVAGSKDIVLATGDDEGSWLEFRTDADQELLARYREAPHECSIPDCLGDLNRRKLELLEQAVELIVLARRATDPHSQDRGKVEYWLARYDELEEK